MGVASESIIFALKSISMLEEITTQSLNEMVEYDLSCFGKEHHTIFTLLEKLREDRRMNNQEIDKIIRVLQG